jgi:hypothetical protein
MTSAGDDYLWEGWCNEEFMRSYFNEIEQIFFQQQISDFELPHIVLTSAHEFVRLKTNVSTMLAMIIYLKKSMLTTKK